MNRWSPSFFLGLLAWGLLGPLGSIGAQSSDLPKDQRGPVFSKHAIAAVCPEATREAIEVLREGGNAVDASVCLAIAMAVTWPEAGNIGGGGFMVIHKPGSPAECIEYREKAPLVTHPAYYAPGDSTLTGKAVGVPGTLAGLHLAHSRHGKLPWKRLIEPARKLAAAGFPVYPGLARSLNNGLKNRPANRFAEFHHCFCPPDGSKEWKAGMIFKQPELARAMELIRDQGPAALYQGELGKALVDTVSATGGSITMEDLGLYRANLRKPLEGTFRGASILVPGPPSGGGTALLQMLNILETFPRASTPRSSPEHLHRLTETARFAYRDRARFLGDPDFTPPAPFLIEKGYAKSLASLVNPASFLGEKELGSPIPLAPEPDHTTHFSVIDGQGMAVANTYTLEDSYGSGVVVKGFGFLLNNEMGDFNWVPGLTNTKGKVGTPPNLIAPEKRMLSSQTPVIVTKGGKVWIVSGSPGGRTIPNTVTQVVWNIMDFGMTAKEAVGTPRLHHQWMPNELRIEPNLSAEWEASIGEIKNRGMKVIRSRQGDAHTLVRNPETGKIEAAADPRLAGSAQGD